LLGNGIKGLNYYIGVGGITPCLTSPTLPMSTLNKSLQYKDKSFITEDTGSFYDYGAPIGMLGQRNPNYEVINQFGKYIQLNSKKLLASEVLYDNDIVILNYHPYSRLRFDSSKLGNYINYQKIYQKYRYHEYSLVKNLGYKPTWMDLEQCSFEKLSRHKVALITFSSFLSIESMNLLKRYVEEGGILISFYDIPTRDENLRQQNILANIYKASIHQRESSKTIFISGKKITEFHLLHSIDTADEIKNTSNDNEDAIIACDNWSHPSKVYAIHRIFQKGQIYHFGFIPSIDKTSIELFGNIFDSFKMKLRNTIFPKDLTVLRLKSDNNEELVTVSNLTQKKIEGAEFVFNNVLNEDGESTIHLKDLTILKRSSTQWAINKEINENIYVKICTSEINEIHKRTQNGTIHYLVSGTHFKGSRNVLEVNLKYLPEKIVSGGKDITKRVFQPDNKLRVQFDKSEHQGQPMFKIRVVYTDDLDLSIDLKVDNKSEIVDFNMKKTNTFNDKIS
jgi:hypothetical protein